MTTPYVPDQFAIEIAQVIFTTFIAFSAIIALVLYIFKAIAIYKLSKNRGYKKPWIAFIPIVNSYLLGAVADNINMCIQKRTIFRYLLLVADGLTFAVSLMTYPMAYKMMNEGFIYSENPAVIFDQMPSYMGISALSGLLGLATIIITGFVLYRIYMDYAPQSGVVYLVLSLLFQVTMPFFLFSIRNKPSISMSYAQQAPQNQQYYNIQ